MKPLLKAAPIIMLAALNTQPVQAEIEHETKKSIALVSSGIIGGILGGPIGFIVAGIGGVLVVDAVYDENKMLESSAPIVIAEQTTPQMKEDMMNHAIAKDYKVGESVTDLTTIVIDANESSPIDDGAIELSSSDTIDTNNSVIQSATTAHSSTTENPVRVSLLFDTNEDQLSYSMLKSIDDVTEAIKAEPNSLIRIDGFTDPRGSQAFNLDLAHRRAENVANYLIEQGIDRNRIIVRSMGESQSSASSEDYLAYAQDRKVELSLDSSLTATSSPSCDDTRSEVNDSCKSIEAASLLETSENTIAELDGGLAQGN